MQWRLPCTPDTQINLILSGCNFCYNVIEDVKVTTMDNPGL